MIRSIKTFLKGYIGEFKANALNKMMLDNDDFYVINNLTIPKYHNSDDDHLTTQVDGVLISKSTNQVIVLEVKNYNGLIIGDVNDRNWVAKYGDNVFEKYNPLFQNYGHIKSIQNLIKEKLDIDESYTRSQLNIPKASQVEFGTKGKHISFTLKEQIEKEAKVQKLTALIC